MTEVLVERHAEQPLTDADIARMMADAGGCLAIHRVHWNRSLLSADGQELICHFSGTDLESVRAGLKAQGPLRAKLWACTSEDVPGLTNDELAQANVLASFGAEQPMTPGELHSQGDASSCLGNHRVRLVRMLISIDRRRVICLYFAPDAESVRLALREAKAPVERVWAFRQFRP